MKFHIVKYGEGKEKIAKLYNLELEDITRLNPTINNRELIVGEKIKIGDNKESLIENITKIYSDSSKDESIKEEMYICPHCKNIILIPKKQEP
ncbi:MAG: LysM peptidoglycan-binding domain-containing protein [Bacilli bacterium]|nr:LysM peptidoglycan-binding domain-containing protein [Bacilli bacterium]